MIRLARRRAGVLVLVMAPVIGGCSLDLTSDEGCLRHPMFESVARLHVVVSRPDPTSSHDGVTSDYLPTIRRISYDRLAISRVLLQRVVERLHLDMTPDQLARKIHARAEGDQKDAVVTMTVTAADPTVAQQIAAVESEVFAAYLTELEMTPTKVTVIDPATYNPGKVACGS